ncbi:LysR family transcriptional regulator [Sphingobium aromaticiconvertens]|uniref:LysR family transcriptional regulator n=1 Tax=Sphingobium aromaticiconvertens TaxID=365341 RepID=UPI003018C7BD
MDTPSLRQLDIFAQMVASGSIARCARDLGLSIDVVERDMAALEKRLGYRLFDYRAGEAQLTDAGRKTVRAMTLLSEKGQDWSEDAPAPPEQAPEAEAVIASPPPAPEPRPVRLVDLDPEPQDDRQQVMIAAPAPVFSHFQDALTAFEETSNDCVITLDLGVQVADEAGRAMMRGSADITYFYALAEPTAFPSRYAWSEQLSLYLGSDHPLAGLDLVQLSDLNDVDAVGLDPRSGLRRIVEQALEKAGLPQRAPILESDNLFDIMTAVREGAGYFAAFGPLARDFGRMPGIKRVPLATSLPQVEVRQAVRAAMADDPVVSTLAEYLCR